MSGTLNKVMLIGYLGDEVKVHYFEFWNLLTLYFRFCKTVRQFSITKFEFLETKSRKCPKFSITNFEF